MIFIVSEMNSIACQNALMDLFRGKLDEDAPDLKLTSTIRLSSDETVDESGGSTRRVRSAI